MVSLLRKSLSLLVVVVVLTGCGPRETSVTTIRFVTWGNEREEARIRRMVDIFELRHPDIRVEMRITPWTRILDVLMISTAGGSPPDVSRVSSEWYAPLAAKGLLEPLDSYVRRDHYDLGDFYSEAIEGWGKFGGRLYLIPTDIDIYAMYFNKAIFDKRHIPYPDLSWDWEKLVEVARKLTRDTDGDGRVDQWGCATDPWWMAYVYQNGGAVLTPDLTRCALDRPAAYNGVQFAADLINKHKVAPNPEESAQTGATKLFTSGRIGMFVSGSWAAPLIFAREVKGFTYDVAPLPKGPRARASFIGGAGYAILSRSRHKQAAWEFVKWMTGPEYQADAAKSSGIVPSRRSVARSGAFLNANEPPRHRAVFLEMTPFGRANPPVAVSPEMNQIIGSEFELVMLGRKSARDACLKVCPIVNQLLGQQ